MKKIVTTLCIPYENERVLLGMKKRGFGEGRWNGFGGKVEPGEDVAQAARRETREEAGIEPVALEKRGILEFYFAGKDEMIEMHIFGAPRFSGEPTETEEMRPEWFAFNKIPFVEMWPDDRYWFPLFLDGKLFKGKFVFEGHDVILEQELQEVTRL